MIVERVAYGIARGIKKANPEQTADLDVLEYGLKIIVNAAAIIVISLTLSIIFDTFLSTLLVVIGFPLLRFFSGGIHVKSSDHCVLISVGILVFIPLISLNDISVMVVNIITFALIGIFAPSHMESNNKIFKNKTALKLLSLLILTINLTIIHSDVLTLTFFVQALSTIHFKKKEV